MGAVGRGWENVRRKSEIVTETPRQEETWGFSKIVMP